MISNINSNLNCVYYENYFLKCMKLPATKDKCKYEFDIWFKCIKYANHIYD